MLIVIQTVEYISIVDKFHNIFIIIKCLYWLENLVLFVFLTMVVTAQLREANKRSSNSCNLFFLTFSEKSFFIDSRTHLLQSSILHELGSTIYEIH